LGDFLRAERRGIASGEDGTESPSGTVITKFSANVKDGVGCDEEDEDDDEEDDEGESGGTSDDDDDEDEEEVEGRERMEVEASMKPI
jgi:hypothetical protein